MPAKLPKTKEEPQRLLFVMLKISA